MTTDIDFDAVLEGGHTAPLDADMVPDENQTHFCRSCQEPLVGLYCADCGQKNDDFRRPLWRLGKEAFASLTAVENRIWRTWGALLFKPGKVAREYADGRREHWSSPVRVYIFTSILLFGFMELTGTMFFALEAKLTPKEGVIKPAEEWTVEDVGWSISSHWFPTQADVDDWNEDVNFELLRERMSGGGNRSSFADGIANALQDGDDIDLTEALAAEIANGRDFTEDDVVEFRESMEELRDSLPASAEAGRERIDQGIRELEAAYRAQVAKREGASTDSDVDAGEVTVELRSGNVTEVTTYPGNTVEIDDSNAQRIFIDYIQNPAIGNNILNKWLPRIIFLMMPLTMFIGALFIRGRRRRRVFGKRDPEAQPALLYDHLVHAAYIHAVAYFVLFIGIMLARYTPMPGSLAGLGLLGYMFVYLPISLRRMFRRGWFKTIWTAYGVALIHFTFVVTLVSIALVSGFDDIYDLSG